MSIELLKEIEKTIVTKNSLNCNLSKFEDTFWHEKITASALRM